MPLPQISLDAAKPFFLAATYWRDAMKVIGSKAYARLELINFSWQGHLITYDEGRALVSLPEGQIVLYPDLKRRADYDALMIKNMHLAARYPQGVPIHPLINQPTLYRRSGFRWTLPVTCNVYYCDDWSAIADQSQAFDLGAISA